MTVHGWAVFILAMLVPSSSAASTREESCQQAQSKCVARNGCGLALTNYFIDCNSLIQGETNSCSKRCKKALISLLSTDEREGEDFMNCRCRGSSFCETQKARMNICARDVIPAMKAINDENTAISCSLAEMICRADTPCLTALAYYEEHCSKLLRGEKCTPSCNNSLNILYRTPKAWKLKNCICDGTEELPIPCQTLQRNTERLCFLGRSVTSRTASSTFSLDDDAVTHAHHHQHGRKNVTRGVKNKGDGNKHVPNASQTIHFQSFALLTLLMATFSSNQHFMF